MATPQTTCHIDLQPRGSIKTLKFLSNYLRHTTNLFSNWNQNYLKPILGFLLRVWGKGRGSHSEPCHGTTFLCTFIHCDVDIIVSINGSHDTYLFIHCIAKILTWYRNADNHGLNKYFPSVFYASIFILTMYYIIFSFCNVWWPSQKQPQYRKSLCNAISI